MRSNPRPAVAWNSPQLARAFGIDSVYELFELLLSRLLCAEVCCWGLPEDKKSEMKLWWTASRT